MQQSQHLERRLPGLVQRFILADTLPACSSCCCRCCCYWQAREKLCWHSDICCAHQTPIGKLFVFLWRFFSGQTRQSLKKISYALLRIAPLSTNRRVRSARSGVYHVYMSTVICGTRAALLLSVRQKYRP